MSFTIKRLFFDIEVSPCIGFFWKPGYKLNIPHQNIIKESGIICLSYKWEHEKKVHTLKWNRNQCDKKLLKDFIKIASKADELIGHNIDKFDLAWIRTRCFIHDLDMFPKYTTTDTLKIARSKFRFNSNRLDYLSQLTGGKGKLPTGFDLWRDITLYRCKKSMAKMVRYCEVDVLELERVYKRFAKHIPAKQNYGALYESNKSGCPECGSNDLMANGTRATLAGTIKRQFKCRPCGKYHTKTIKRA